MRVTRAWTPGLSRIPHQYWSVPVGNSTWQCENPFRQQENHQHVNLSQNRVLYQFDIWWIIICSLLYHQIIWYLRLIIIFPRWKMVKHEGLTVVRWTAALFRALRFYVARRREARLGSHGSNGSSAGKIMAPHGQKAPKIWRTEE